MAIPKLALDDLFQLKGILINDENIFTPSESYMSIFKISQDQCFINIELGNLWVIESLYLHCL